MNVGVCTRYQPRDVTYAALQVADVARCCGNQVSVYTTSPRRPPVHARWDEKVVRGLPFTAWAGPLDTIIWTECPPADQVDWCRRPRGGAPPPGEAVPGRRLVLVSSWHDTLAQVRAVYPRFTAVVAPSRAAHDFLAGDAGLANVTAVPWSPGTPVTVRHPPPAGHQPSVHVPLCDGHGRAFDPAAVDLVERLLRRRPGVRVRVTLNGRSGEVVRRLERRAREYPDLVLTKCGDFESFLRHLGAHDLTVLVATCESFGMTALCSLHAGVPVIAFAVPPLDEFVVPGGNGVLVPGVVPDRPPGTAGNDPEDQARFAAALADLLARPEDLAGLRAGCAAGLAARAEAFARAWREILGEH